MTEVMTAAEIATKRKVSPERARQIARKIGKQNKDGKWEVTTADYEKWASTARPGPKKTAKSRKTKPKTAAPAVQSTVAQQLNGSAALVLDVLSDRSLDDKTARFMAKYLIQKA